MGHDQRNEERCVRDQKSDSSSNEEDYFQQNQGFVRDIPNQDRGDMNTIFFFEQETNSSLIYKRE